MFSNRTISRERAPAPICLVVKIQFINENNHIKLTEKRSSKRFQRGRTTHTHTKSCIKKLFSSTIIAHVSVVYMDLLLFDVGDDSRCEVIERVKEQT